MKISPKNEKLKILRKTRFFRFFPQHTLVGLLNSQPRRRPCLAGNVLSTSGWGTRTDYSYCYTPQTWYLVHFPFSGFFFSTWLKFRFSSSKQKSERHGSKQIYTKRGEKGLSRLADLRFGSFAEWWQYFPGKLFSAWFFKILEFPKNMFFPVVWHDHRTKWIVA